MNLFKKFLFLVTFISFSFSVHAGITTNTEIGTLTSEDIGEAITDLQISEQLLTEKSLADMTFSFVENYPDKIKQRYIYKAYIINQKQQRLGIVQMMTPKNDEGSTVILGVKDKKMMIISCTTEDEVLNWHKGICAKELAKSFDVNITDAIVKKNEKIITLPTK